MCIFSGEVRTVSGTHILVAPGRDANTQLTVYSNTAHMKTNRGVMVLPVPKRAGFTPVNLETVPDLFKKCKAACPVDVVARGMQMKSLSYSTNSADHLEVKQVGSYKASFVPSHADFARLHPDVFPVEADVVAFLRESYDDAIFGFVACRLDEKRTYHPFGYMHAQLPGGGLFIPTLHRHMQRVGDTWTNEPDWDHRIWCVNASINNLKQRVYTATEKDPSMLKIVPWDALPPLQVCHTLNGYRVGGAGSRTYAANHDLMAVETSAPAAAASTQGDE